MKYKKFTENAELCVFPNHVPVVIKDTYACSCPFHILYVSNRDVYCIESISYRYHKTDTGIISKWQINDTFNDTFMMILIRIELVWHKNKWFFFLLNACFVFHFYIIWKIMVPEYYYTVYWVYQKAKRKKVNSLVTFYS